MMIQTFRAPTFQEACAQIKSALGPRAFIIKHECVRDGSIWGWLLGRYHFEVTAARIDGMAGARPTPGRSSRPSDAGRPTPRDEVFARGEFDGLDEEALRALARRATLADDGEAPARDRVSRVGTPESRPAVEAPPSPARATVHAAPTAPTAPTVAPAVDAPLSPSSPPASPDELGSLKSQMSQMASLLQQFMTVQDMRTAKLEKTLATGLPAEVTQPQVPSSQALAAAPGPVATVEPGPSAATLPVRDLVAALRRAEFEAGLIAQARGHLFEVMDETALASETAVRECLVDYLAGRVRTTGGVRLHRGEKGKVVALVGPTGVGKTTTLAKLAAGLKFNFGLSVGFITIDTYRLAACDQLAQYGKIINVPVHIAFEPKDVREGLEAMADMDVVLVDTVGRNAKNRAEVDDIRRFLDCGRPVETHLLLSAGAKFSDLRKDLENFRPLDYGQVIITKVDEAASFGTVLSLLSSTGTAVSYLTTGQNVPDDITVADARRMVAMALDEGVEDAAPAEVAPAAAVAAAAVERSREAAPRI